MTVRHRILVFTLLIVAGLLLYGNTLDNGFHYDDAYVILKNKGLTQTSQILDVFTGMEQAGPDPLYRKHYRPVVYVSYMMNYALGGWNPVGYHLVNLLLHILVVFLTALVLWGLTGRWFVGVLTGLLFLIHPFNAEAVNYITARSSQLYALFYLLAFYAYLRYRPPIFWNRDTDSRERPSSGLHHPSILWLWVCLISFILAMLSKELAVTLPLVIVLYEWLMRPAVTWRARLKFLGTPISISVVVVVSYLLIRRTLVGRVLSPEGISDMAGHIATQAVLFIRTLGLILVPMDLTIDHPVEIYRTLAVWPVVGAVLVGLIYFGAALVWGRSRDPGRRTRAFLLLWFPVTLSPLMVIPLNAMLQENRAYLAAVGVLGLMAIVVEAANRRARHHPWLLRGGWVGFTIILLIYAGLTFERNAVWQSDVTLWSDAVLKNPHSAQSHMGLGGAYQDNKELDRAIREYQTAIRLKPEEYKPRGNLAQIYRQQGRYDEAVAEYRIVLRLVPGDAEAHYGLGRTYHLAGKLDRALQSYAASLAINPRHENAIFRMGTVYAGRGQWDLAETTFQRLLAVNPRHAETYNVLGLLAVMRGDGKQGKSLFREAIRLDPGNAGYRRNLSMATTTGSGKWNAGAPR